VAVVQDPVQMARQQAAERLEGRHPLPAQGAEPDGQEAPGPALIGVGPELGELIAEEVGLGQPPVEGKERAERLAVVPVQVGPAPEQQSALAADQGAGLAALPEELRPPGSRRPPHWRGGGRGTCRRRSGRGAGARAGSARRAPTCRRRLPGRIGDAGGATPRQSSGPGSPACTRDPARAAPRSRGY
jgi:hypothetical protein